MIPSAELEAADRVLCEFEEARALPVITARAWGLSHFLMGGRTSRTSICTDAKPVGWEERTDAGRAGNDETPPGPSRSVEAAP